MSIEQAVVEKLRMLSPDKQQEVLDFVEFLEARRQHSVQASQRQPEISALDAARQVMGVVGDGPADLSTNPKYMDGFGEA